MGIRNFFPWIRVHNFKLEFVDSGLYFFPDENNFKYPLLQVGAGYVEKSLEFGSNRPKINGTDRIRILIPAYYSCSYHGTQGKNRSYVIFLTF